MIYMKHTISKMVGQNRYRTRITVDGVIKHIYGKTQKEVCEKLREVIKANKNKRTETYTLQKWYEKWIELYKINNVRPSTLYSYSSIYKNYIIKLPNKNLKLYTSIELMEFISKIKMERQRAKTFDLLKDLFDKACKNKLVSTNPMLAFKKPKSESKDVMPMNKKEQQQFINACKGTSYEDYFLIALYTGMRKSELMAITINDIDFENKLIKVTKIVNTSNKIVEHTKTKTSKRLIPLFEKCEQIFLKYRNNKSGERIFPLSQAQTTRKFNEVLKKSKLTGFTIHSLRHTFATNCFELGIPTKQVQQWLGHSDSKITESIYIGVTNEYEKINIDKVNTSQK